MCTLVHSVLSVNKSSDPFKNGPVQTINCIQFQVKYAFSNINSSINSNSIVLTTTTTTTTLTKPAYTWVHESIIWLFCFFFLSSFLLLRLNCWQYINIVDTSRKWYLKKSRIFLLFSFDCNFFYFFGLLSLYFFFFLFLFSQPGGKHSCIGFLFGACKKRPIGIFRLFKSIWRHTDSQVYFSFIQFE